MSHFVASVTDSTPRPTDFFGPATSKGYSITDFSVATGSSGGVTSSDSDFTLALQPDAGVMKLIAAGSASPTANQMRIGED